VDVLFSDVVMPGSMDGVQLSVAAARLRPGLKILLTSGYVASREALAEHDFPLLSKPYDRGQLAARLHAVLHD
jgi:DNA-binding LytR/AlgR family response regulator